MPPSPASPAPADRRAPAWPWYVGAAAAVTATAVAGGRFVDPAGTWYRALRKPSWQPPPWAFGAIWTPLYGSLAWAGGRALATTRGGERTRLLGSLGLNLVLNAGWNALFFGRRSPRAGLAGTVLLDLSNAELLMRVSRADRPAGRALLPYATWCLFATALNGALVRLNPGSGHPGPRAGR
ncbi:TspO/MBR family protein [Streptomyces sp. NPDC006460]|uniref:TspO/MBR family protein n=1 Tax=Streptomyces sp. NPDC006460 TaxID=3154304 RepID=UPI0033BF2EFC